MVVDHRFGFVDKSGKIAINPQFDAAGRFSEGLAEVSVGKQSGYVDKLGKLVINPQFDVAATFTDGLAAVKSRYQAAPTGWKPSISTNAVSPHRPQPST